MRRAFSYVIDHGLRGVIRVVPWRYVVLAFLLACAVVPAILGRVRPDPGSLAQAELLHIAYVLGVGGLFAWAVWAVLRFWMKRLKRDD